MILSSREESHFAALCRVCDKIGRVGTGESHYFLQSKRHWLNWVLEHGASNNVSNRRIVTKTYKELRNLNTQAPKSSNH